MGGFQICRYYADTIGLQVFALPNVHQGFTNTFDALLRPRVGGSTTGQLNPTFQDPTPDLVFRRPPPFGGRRKTKSGVGS